MKTLDMEAINTTILFFFIISCFLMFISGGKFHEETTAYYKLWAESMSPLSFNLLGSFSLLSGSVFYWANPDYCTNNGKSFRLLYVHPLNATFTTGAAGAATLFSMCLGFMIYHDRYDYALVVFAVAFHILLILWGLAKLDGILKSENVSSQHKKILGFGLFHLVIIVSLFYVVKYSVAWL
uniref:hypothetical protein n=1 Tax=Ningiella ruwaisensis TaxID=2364274 RepID=UPI0010A030CB|nr:hypothetical protein [Ningiella ruwaisensis]